MKFQDSSFNGLKVTVGTKSVTHARNHARTLQKQYAPSTFSNLGGITSQPTLLQSESISCPQNQNQK